MLDALSPLGDECIFGGDGAIYLWAKLPAGATPATMRMPPSIDCAEPSTGTACGTYRFGLLSINCLTSNAGCEDDEAVVSWLVRHHKARSLRFLQGSCACCELAEVELLTAVLEPAVTSRAACRCAYFPAAAAGRQVTHVWHLPTYDRTTARRPRDG